MIKYQTYINPVKYQTYINTARKIRQLKILIDVFFATAENP